MLTFRMLRKCGFIVSHAFFVAYYVVTYRSSSDYWVLTTDLIITLGTQARPASYYYLLLVIFCVVVWWNDELRFHFVEWCAETQVVEFCVPVYDYESMNSMNSISAWMLQMLGCSSCIILRFVWVRGHDCHDVGKHESLKPIRSNWG